MLHYVKSFLSDEFFIAPEELTVDENVGERNHGILKQFTISWGKFGEICSWEEYGRRPMLSYGIATEWHTLSTDNFGEALEYIKSICKKKSSGIFLRKYKLTLEKVEEQQKRIEKLREKNRELKYAPGGRGYTEAKENFESLAL
ncbi:hypothetical protein ISTM_465 [Insectomime virus]|uniref:Uncharacterized protein n=1 Tax=Tunisvirus fontaine2 TaxID=1421067 RepID=V9SDT0_9VIRU|nr:hypothetical protein D1R32_gp336 [Tunisvirus fontaine2]AHA46363.1 hypothetical protein ISTM_465 [Insectomime virus]AHC55053.1 hypothetical protein TNS_ORF335 [Tunisvirus fontaine2]